MGRKNRREAAGSGDDGVSLERQPGRGRPDQRQGVRRTLVVGRVVAGQVLGGVRDHLRRTAPGHDLRVANIRRTQGLPYLTQSIIDRQVRDERLPTPGIVTVRDLAAVLRTEAALVGAPTTGLLEPLTFGEGLNLVHRRREQTQRDRRHLIEVAVALPDEDGTLAAESIAVQRRIVSDETARVAAGKKAAYGMFRIPVVTLEAQHPDTPVAQLLASVALPASLELEPISDFDNTLVET